MSRNGREDRQSSHVLLERLAAPVTCLSWQSFAPLSSPTNTTQHNKNLVTQLFSTRTQNDDHHRYLTLLLRLPFRELTSLQATDQPNRRKQTRGRASARRKTNKVGPPSAPTWQRKLNSSPDKAIASMFSKLSMEQSAKQKQKRKKVRTAIANNLQSGEQGGEQSSKQSSKQRNKSSKAWKKRETRRRSKVCQHWADGHCEKGDLCKYKHGEEETGEEDVGEMDTGEKDIGENDAGEDDVEMEGAKLQMTLPFRGM